MSEPTTGADVNEERDRSIGKAVEEGGWEIGELAELFGMSPRRIAHLAQARRIDNRINEKIARGE